MSDPRPDVTPVAQPVTDDSVRVRQVSHHQFSWVAGEAGRPGTFTLQLILDQGAWEEVLTVEAGDAKVLRRLLQHHGDVVFDVGRRTLVLGTTPVGA